uniref:Uncharacterized protein n=1 Tax=Sciurus vulgaris TaxID=55149 RepID=A0A8D2DE03_SCIVU
FKNQTVFLLAAIALLCYQCSKFKENFCEHELRTCEAVEGESCMIRRYWSFPYSCNKCVHRYESSCMKNCRESREYTADGNKLTLCCDYYDFCNELKWPIAIP